MKIEALNTKVLLLQSSPDISCNNDKNENINKTTEDDVQLINLCNDNEITQMPQKKEISTDTEAEMLALNNKIEKMEQLLNKYKDSLKTSKEKNSQIHAELQMLSNELESKNKEINDLNLTVGQLTEAKQKIEELSNLNEELQNKITEYEFNKTREQSTLEADFQEAQEEIVKLNSKIEVFSKREEEYAISLAENKLSIHKELESKEAEIRSLKDKLDISKKEILSLNIVVNDYKKNLSLLETERSKLMQDSKELNLTKSRIADMEVQIEELSKKCQGLEQSQTKADEGYKCLQLQLKQETAEKLAMIDRNVYLENRNTHLSEENAKKSTQISTLESELQKKDEAIKTLASEDCKIDELVAELNMWKDKYSKLESEIQEERDELIKLQSEIEKLLANHELIRSQNIEFRKVVSDLKSENESLQERLVKTNKLKSNCLKLANEIKNIKNLTKLISNDAKSLQIINNQAFISLVEQINYALKNASQSDHNLYSDVKLKNVTLQQEIESLQVKYDTLSQQFQLTEKDNTDLKSTVSEFKSEKTTLVEQAKNQYESVIQQLNFAKEENENLSHKVNEMENNFQNLQLAIEFEKKQYFDTIEKLKMAENEKQELLIRLENIEKQNDCLNKELDALREIHRVSEEEANMVKHENSDLLKEMKNKDDQIASVNTLQEEYKALTSENISLKSQAENLADSYKHLETEISDVRKAHAEIVSEKDRLSKVIEQLESNACKVTLNQDSQTDNEEEQKAKNQIVNDLETLQESQLVQSGDNELSNKYISIKSEYDILREENRRFKSDIEGLQTYLTKISKENSILNDKLRELIATSEHSTDHNAISDFSELKNDFQASKDKIDDLLRENTLLIEENLELKDQLQFQNHPQTNQSVRSSDKEVALITEKYNNLLQVNSTLEQRLADLEQMNKSFNGNIAQVQDKNEKLRLTNEKLERRLDEALVSLRHLHSLQENTELEYLRNILYEYLTGSGMHSVTLAKVLSAIVKFDDMQTKLVLQKEKERQGFVSFFLNSYI